MSIRLMIVDDHDLVRLALRSILHGCSVIEVVGEANNGLAAVEMAVDCGPDVVLMDIRMPRMDGLTATKAIKEKLPNTRVLILSASDHHASLVAALSAGADGCCAKDSDGSDLLLAIQTVHKTGTHG